ncbi:MAG: hypothetical protein ABI743_14835 [bacterium]
MPDPRPTLETAAVISPVDFTISLCLSLGLLFVLATTIHQPEAAARTVDLIREAFRRLW